MNSRYSLTLAALLAMLPQAPAATIYSDLRDLAIPTNFDGVYLDLDTGATGAAAFPGWDINPFFSGSVIGNSPAFQPVRIGTNPLDRVLNLAPGTVISGGLTYASGFGGSGNIGHEHLGLGGDQFQVGTEGYLGFKFTTNASAGPLYGWLRVTLTNNAAGAVIKDWAYDNAGGTIVVGRVQQSAPSGGTQVVTLSPRIGESFTLGSAITDTGGNINSVLKTGPGTTTLATANPFTGSTTVSGGTLEVAAGSLANTASIAVNSGGTLLLNGTNQDRINNAASTALNGGTFALAGSASLDEQAGTLTLSATSTLDFGTFASGHTLRFADSSGASWAEEQTLNIWNWTVGSDHLFFGTDSGSLAAPQLVQIRFYSGAGSGFVGTGGFGSLGEITPIPEPSTVLGALALCGLAGWRELRRRSHRSSNGSFSAP